MSHRFRRRRWIARFVGPIADVKAEGLQQRLGRFMTVVTGGEDENAAALDEFPDDLAFVGGEFALRADTNDDGRAIEALLSDLWKRQREITIAHQRHRHAHGAV